MTHAFDYDLAFSRNIGWFTEDEQRQLKEKRVAIAGLGGVGGSHVVTLARMGITKFNVADFDLFACENTNRQVGANVDTYDAPKLDTMVNMAKAINPEIDIRTFPQGINEENTGAFLQDVDCYVDSLDFFAMPPRITVFDKCVEKNIPSLTAAPIGMGTAYINFMPGDMTFEEHFGMKGLSENEQFLKFFIGLTPTAIQSQYLVDPSRLDLVNKKGPSTIVGCQLAAGVAASQVAKMFLNRGEILNAPWVQHFDAYTNQFEKSYLEGGHTNPQQVKLFETLKIQFGI